MSNETKKDLDALREEINGINEKMLDLFLQRMRVSGDIAEYKKEHDLPILNTGREQEILAQVEEKSGDLSPYALRFFSALMELSKDYQKDLTADGQQGSDPEVG